MFNSILIVQQSRQAGKRANPTFQSACLPNAVAPFTAVAASPYCVHPFA